MNFELSCIKDVCCEWATQLPEVDFLYFFVVPLCLFGHCNVPCEGDEALTHIVTQSL